MDDSHVGIKETRVNDFHTHLNSIDPNIQFTVEIENNGSIAFLDTKTSRLSDGTLSVTVYRKPTHTDRYLDYSSHHHAQHKRSVAKTRLDRANIIPSTLREKSLEAQHVFSALKANGYPLQLLKSCNVNHNRSARPTDAQQQQEEQQQHREQERGTVVLPYVQGLSERISRTLNAFQIKVSHKPINTIRDILRKPKDRPEKDAVSGVVYKINCL